MFGIHDLPLFLASGLLLNLTPGADTLYIVTRSMTLGLRAGIVAALGIGAGCVVHVLLAALGMAAILAASPAAFAIVRIVGALYVVYVGVSLVRAGFRPPPTSAAPVTAGHRAVFLQGLLTNVLNPKVALFFLAFLPQFVDSASTTKSAAMLLLGAIFVFNGTLWCLFVAWSAARLGRGGPGRKASAWVQRGVGGLFMLFGASLLLSGWSTDPAPAFGGSR